MQLSETEIDDVVHDTQHHHFTDDIDLSVFLRTVQQHHVSLSSMADQKASLMIGASFVVLTILFSQLDNGEVSIPLLTLGIPTIFACALSVLSVSPSIKSTDKRAQLPPTPNFLFFGHFSHLSADEFMEEIEEIMAQPESVYRAMIMDIYQMGKILHEKKYRYLAYSYRVFLLGLIATFFAMLATYVAAL